MSFRDDMKDVRRKRKTEIMEKRSNLINEENYKALYDNVFGIIKSRMEGSIKNKNIRYDEGFFSKKNPRYEAYYGIRITVYPSSSENKFYNGVNIYNKEDSSLYGGGWIHLETAYLDDVKVSLKYMFEKSKEDQFDHILTDMHDSERYIKRGNSGKEFTLEEIDSIIMNLKRKWEKNVEADYNLCSCVDYLSDVIAQIKCDWDGNII